MPALKYRKEKPELVWESDNKWMKVYFDAHTDGTAFGKSELYMTLGHEMVGTDHGMFYAKINLNGFWHDVCSFMKSKKV